MQIARHVYENIVAFSNREIDSYSYIVIASKMLFVLRGDPIFNQLWIAASLAMLAPRNDERGHIKGKSST